MNLDTLNVSHSAAPAPTAGSVVYPGGVVRDEVMQTLLRKSLRNIDDNSRRFLPRSALFEYFDSVRVRQLIELLLPGTDSTTLHEVVNYICPGENRCSRCGRDHCTGGRVVFATLIWIAKQDLIPHLLTEGLDICDNTSEQTHTATTWRSIFLQMASPIDLELFHQVRLQLSAAFLECIGPRGTANITIEGAATLPWTKFTTKQGPSPGNPCEIGEVHIHPAHHALDHQHANQFALKIFPASLYTEQNEHLLEAFEDELLANQVTPKHERITPLLTAFQHHQRSYLVFPWAHGGTLKDFWMHHSVDEQHSVKWVIHECLGLADGLAALHGLTEPQGIAHGRGTLPSLSAMLHADIKPTNILCFKIQGQETLFLKYADFGLSKQVAPGLPLASDILHQTKTYRAPEQDVEQEITLKSDVWCLGCLILEFITWSLIGWQGIETFSSKRHREYDSPEATHALGETREDVFFKKQVTKNFWYGRSGLQVGTAVNALRPGKDTKHLARRTYSVQIKKSVQVGCRVKDSVAMHIKSLSSHERCTRELRDLLCIVQEQMLVVDVGKRADSKEVRDSMKRKSLV